MKTKRPLYILLILAIIYISASCWFVNSMISFTKDSVDIKQENASKSNFRERFLNTKEWLNGGNEWRRKMMISEALLNNAEQKHNAAKKISLYFIIGSFGFFIAVFIIYFGCNNFYESITLAVISIAFVCIYAGVSMPMIEIAAFNDNMKIPLKINMKNIPFLGSISFVKDRVIDFSKTFEGRTYYYYQSKSVVELIKLLFKDNNLVVGLAVLCFSVIIPLIKQVLTVTIILTNKVKNNKKLVQIVGIISKWSMADIFIVASYLTYLSFSNMNDSVETEAKIMMGLYYFLAYVVLAISSTQMMERAIKVNEKNNDII